MSGSPVTLVAALAAARKNTQFYPREHPRHVEALDALVSAVAGCTASGAFVLNMHQGRLYAGSEVLTGDAPALASTAEALDARRIESLTFLPGFGADDAAGLAAVLNLRPGPDLDVEKELSLRHVGSLQVARVVDENAEEREERDRSRERDRALYRRFVTAMRRMSAKLQQGKDVDLTEAGGMVPDIMSRLLENPAAVLALATIRGQGDQDLFHTINTMIYALTIGAALELPEEGFASLGVCALVHDIGKAAFAPDAEADYVRLMHPQAGADILARLTAEDPGPMLVAYEHHMGVDGSGWPEHEADYIPHPYSRMVCIANRYEQLTKHADGPSLTPDKAVAQLLRESSGPLDPVFTRVFVQALGVFPIGCMVRLSDQTVAVVCDRSEDPLAPKVRVVYDDRGLELHEPFEVDLRGGVGGTRRRPVRGRAVDRGGHGRDAAGRGGRRQAVAERCPRGGGQPEYGLILCSTSAMSASRRPRSWHASTNLPTVSRSSVVGL
jgi:HD-GYP domain-containing protein (c-di-GMP phosphodiesterase class II)